MTAALEIPAYRLVPTVEPVYTDAPEVSAYAQFREKAHNYGPRVDHGTPGRYRYWGCRCDRCCEAHWRYQKKIRFGLRVPAITGMLGTQRRIRALVAMGYTVLQLEAESGVQVNHLRRIATGQRDPAQVGIYRRTAEKIWQAYERLIWEKPPESRYASRSRNKADRLGWSPPEAWTDETIDKPDAQPYDWMDPNYVDQAQILRILALIRSVPLQGGKKPRKPAIWPTLSDPERWTLVSTLRRQQMSDNQIALNLGVQVNRLRVWLARDDWSEVAA